MNNYVLKTKEGEKIKEIKAYDYDNAVEIFASNKLILPSDLLEIYIVDEE